LAAIDRFLGANSTYTEGFPGPRPKEPALRVAVLSCMDSRLALFGALGLRIGDAHLIRNAGGLATPDTLRSLAVSQRFLGTREIAVIHHTDCGMLNFDDEEFRRTLAEESVRDTVASIRESPWLAHRDLVRGFVFDVRSARLSQVD
jgi:carbonic anhydrase